jgi:hypothetical protein
MYVRVLLCYVLLCTQRPCDEPIPRARSPIKLSKGFVVSEVECEPDQARGPNP